MSKEKAYTGHNAYTNTGSCGYSLKRRLWGGCAIFAISMMLTATAALTTAQPAQGVMAMGVLTIIFVAWLARLFKKAVFQPLEEMVRTGRRMIAQQLTTDTGKTEIREFAAMSDVLEDLAADFQEILLCLRTATVNIAGQLASAKSELSGKGSEESVASAAGRLDRIKESIEMLDSLIDGFGFFDVNIRDHRLFQAKAEHHAFDEKTSRSVEDTGVIP